MIEEANLTTVVIAGIATLSSAFGLQQIVMWLLNRKASNKTLDSTLHRTSAELDIVLGDKYKALLVEWEAEVKRLRNESESERHKHAEELEVLRQLLLEGSLQRTAIIQKHDSFLKAVRLLMSVLEQPYWECDINGDCLYVNHFWTVATGINLVDAMGDGWSKAIAVKDRKRVSDAYYQSIQDGNANNPLNFKMVHCETKNTFLVTAYYVIIRANDAPLQIIGVTKLN